jgi:hypothetical protein
MGRIFVCLLYECTHMYWIHKCGWVCLCGGVSIRQDLEQGGADGKIVLLHYVHASSTYKCKKKASFMHSL